LAAIADVELLSGSPLHIPLDAFDADGDALTFTATSTNANVTTYIPAGNRSMKISVASADSAIQGDMILELFEDRVPRVTGRIIELAESGFYDGIIFHRVIDGFMVQTGDPLGTGSGGSDYPDFDDQFHVDLQHNTTGVLSMAKSSDDTNNSQFFIVDTPTDGVNYPRHLDFNHSIFGQLIEGFNVLADISQAPTGTDTIPDVNVVMTSVEIFVDQENGVLMLKAPEGYTGESDITVTVNDGHGGTAQVTFHVNVTADTVDADPFLADVPMIRTAVDTSTTVQLTAIDVENGDRVFADDTLLESNGLVIPIDAHTDLYYIVGRDTGLVEVSPSNGLTGIHPITIATAIYKDAVDYQVVPVYIVPAIAPTAELDMVLRRDATEVDTMGEVDALPGDQWIDEWDSFTIEVWATVTEDGAYGVHTVTTDLTFDNDLFTATKIEHGLVFTENRSGEINNATGTISGLGGTTGVLTIDGYPGVPPNSPVDPDDVEYYGDGRPVLVARVYFEPNLSGPGVPNGATSGHVQPATDLGFTFADAEVRWSPVDATALTTRTLQNAELWPVMYDVDDDNEIGLGDLSYFAAAYHHEVGDTTVGYTWACDFDGDGIEVGLGDLSYFAAAYGRDAGDPGRVPYPANFPGNWPSITEGAAPMSAPAGGEESSAPGSESSSIDNASGWENAFAFEQASAASRDSSGAERQKNDAVDTIMQYYDLP